MARTKPHGHRSLDQGLGLGNRKTSSLKKSRDRTPKVPSPIASAPVASRTRRRRRAGADPWIPKRKPNKSNPRPRSPPATHFTCRICAEEKPVDEFIKWVGPRKRYSAAIGIPFGCVSHLCRNPRSKNDPVCKECIGQFLSARLDTVGARQVGTGCLEPGCQNPWDSAFVLRYLPSGSQLEKYNNGMLTVWMENLNPKLFHCISEDCSSVGMLDVNAPGYPQVTCNDCSTRMCAVCNVAWHPRVTCAEHAAKTINIQMSDPEKDVLQLMQTKDGRRCPNCQLVIEKDGGCDSMYCAGCRTFFNWQTAASAVLGTRTPLQAVPGRPYWLVQPKNRVCETDVILKAERAKARAEMRAERKRKRGGDENTPLRRSARCAALNNRIDAST